MFTKLPIDTIYSIVEVATGVAGFAIALYTVRRNRLAAICFGSLGAAIAVLGFLLSWNAPGRTSSISQKRLTDKPF